MWLAVVAVGSCHVELGGGGLTRSVEQVLVGEGVNIDSAWALILVEDNVVRESSVVLPSHRLTLGDSHLETQEEEEEEEEEEEIRI